MATNSFRIFSPFGKNAPTSAYPAFSTLIKTLGDAAIVRRETTDLRTRIYFFSKDGAQLRVAWSTSDTARVAFTTSQPLIVTDLMGNSRTVAPVAGVVALTLTDDPIYIAGAVTGVQEMGRDVLLMDSAANYSEVQGSANGTSLYGYEVNSVPDPPFTLFTLRPTEYGSRWMSSHDFAQLRIDNAHPCLRQQSCAHHPPLAQRCRGAGEDSGVRPPVVRGGRRDRPGDSRRWHGHPHAARRAVERQRHQLHRSREPARRLHRRSHGHARSRRGHFLRRHRLRVSDQPALRGRRSGRRIHRRSRW